jgi:hypothetical protein
MRVYRTPIRARSDAASLRPGEGVPMPTTYAITWDEAGHRPYSGKLELRPRALRLEAGADGDLRTSVVREVPYDDVTEVRVGRTALDRIGDRPTLIVERRAGAPLRIASVVQPGIVAELAERLAAVLLGGEGPIRVVVILPLKPGARQQVRELLAQGPPFDPEGVGLERHEVFLTDEEAVFLFEGLARPVLQRLLGRLDVWAAAAAWREHVAGPARLAEDAYSWSRGSGVDGDSALGKTPKVGDVFSSTSAPTSR